MQLRLIYECLGRLRSGSQKGQDNERKFWAILGLIKCIPAFMGLFFAVLLSSFYLQRNLEELAD